MEDRRNIEDRRHSSRDERATPAHGSSMAYGMSLTISQLSAENEILAARVAELEEKLNQADRLVGIYVDRELMNDDSPECEGHPAGPTFDATGPYGLAGDGCNA